MEKPNALTPLCVQSPGLKSRAKFFSPFGAIEHPIKHRYRLEAYATLRRRAAAEGPNRENKEVGVKTGRITPKAIQKGYRPANGTGE
jgi:hypothetical protein